MEAQPFKINSDDFLEETEKRSRAAKVLSTPEGREKFFIEPLTKAMNELNERAHYKDGEALEFTGGPNDIKDYYDEPENSRFQIKLANDVTSETGIGGTLHIRYDPFEDSVNPFIMENHRIWDLGYDTQEIARVSSFEELIKPLTKVIAPYLDFSLKKDTVDKDLGL